MIVGPGGLGLGPILVLLLCMGLHSSSRMFQIIRLGTSTTHELYSMQCPGLLNARASANEHVSMPPQHCVMLSASQGHISTQRPFFCPMHIIHV
ncbi:hypothetical protein TorRG33x02_042700 [Trema orientale]|uniref:Uncharacterized protein n=1 Tax=Trema orientale TaxID=63057 RepID=A0A2P5FPW3_TREOI|nr:hypothetical protein TorRG33x02_042700 [Trema orientale]